MVKELARNPSSPTSPATTRTRASARNSVIDRDTASRLGIAPADIDNTLDDAFGQRQVSTMFTQLNQYHVVMEVPPRLPDRPRPAHQHLRKSANGHTGPAQRSAALGTQQTLRSPSATRASSPRHGSASTSPRASLGDAVNAVQRSKSASTCPLSVNATFQGTAAAFQASLTNEPILILAALITVYIVLGVLYESYIHPITILSTLPSAGVGAILALLRHQTDSRVIALIGIILLIGIVKKNAIMMIDFALDAERKEGKRPRKPSTRPACCASAPS